MALNRRGRVLAVLDVLRKEGGEPGHSIHSWRCEYPDKYGPCDCLEQVAEMIVTALDGPEEYHVMPVRDLVRHETSKECVCRPTEDQNVWIHHSLDGREGTEGAGL